MGAVISSRTPEGLPSRCAVCGAETNIEFSVPAEDATCPNCGCLLWHSARVLELICEWLGVSPENIRPETTFRELGFDSLDTVELVMGLEEEFDLTIPDDVAERILTIGDAVRYIESQKR
jgi:acyl carrier protein